MKKAIITGATGFIGGALTRRLLSDGVTVYGVDIDPGKLDYMKQYGDFVPVVADFSAYDKLSEVICERGFDALFHLAWIGTTSVTNEYKDYISQLINVKASCDIVSSSKALRCEKIIGICSNHAFTINKHNNSLDSSIYGLSKKYTAELLNIITFKEKIPYLTAIIPNVFGKGDKPETAVMFFINELIANKSIRLITGEDPEDWIYIDDAVNGLIALEKAEDYYSEYYIGHQTITTFKEKLLLMRDLLNSKSDLLFGEYENNLVVDYSKFDLTKLYKETGYIASDNFETQILKTANWIKSLSSTSTTG